MHERERTFLFALECKIGAEVKLNLKIIAADRSLLCAPPDRGMNKKLDAAQ